MDSYPKVGDVLIFCGLGTSRSSAGYTPGYFYNQTSELRHEAQEWAIELLVEYLFKPIMGFGTLMIGWPIVRKYGNGIQLVYPPLPEIRIRTQMPQLPAPHLELGKLKSPPPNACRYSYLKCNRPLICYLIVAETIWSDNVD